QEWIDVPQEGPITGRGLGLLDMVRAIAEDRPHVASGEVGYHVLDVMLSAEESATSGEFVTVESSVSEVPLVPVDFDPLERTIWSSASPDRTHGLVARPAGVPRRASPVGAGRLLTLPDHHIQWRQARRKCHSGTSCAPHATGCDPPWRSCAPSGLTAGRRRRPQARRAPNPARCPGQARPGMLRARPCPQSMPGWSRTLE